MIQQLEKCSKKYNCTMFAIRFTNWMTNPVYPPSFFDGKNTKMVFKLNNFYGICLKIYKGLLFVYKKISVIIRKWILMLTYILKHFNIFFKITIITINTTSFLS